jgi:alpha-amylase/alpha-mannosidase (GH57 family)
MPALLLGHPEVHVTINVTPVLLDQLLDYAEGRAWDDALVLTRTSAGRLSARDRESLLGTFFEADWHGQIFPHQRYTDLFTRRLQGLPFRAGDLRDLQVWFTLAWFNQAFRDGPVKLVTGDTTEVHRLVAKGRGFSQRDVEALLAEQAKVLRAIVPLLRLLEERGQVELSTTPYYHPILPLLIDSDSAATELAQVRLPARFAHPEDAEAQVRLALARHAEVFGRAPRGVWPAEGAVSQEAATLLARQGLRWFASDAGVLGRSGMWGYRVDQPDVASRPYRVGEGTNGIVGFFRDPWLSDRIGFEYHRVEERKAADQFVAQIKERIAKRLEAPAGHVATIALDGENPWGAYRQDGRAFLQMLYQRLADDPALVTVTFSEFQDGNPERGVPAHPPVDLELLQPLATGSWIDEAGSQPGVDLGTWIGEPEENAAWALLARAREEIPVAAEEAAPGESAIRALYAAEGSDWFWWLGRDQDSGRDQEFDDLFRCHLSAAYRASGRASPPELERHLVPHTLTWSHVAPVQEIQEGDDLVVVTNCPGSLEWRYDDGIPQQSPLFPVTGALGGLGRHRLNLAPIPPRHPRHRVPVPLCSRGLRGTLSVSGRLLATCQRPGSGERRGGLQARGYYHAVRKACQDRMTSPSGSGSVSRRRMSRARTGYRTTSAPCGSSTSRPSASRRLRATFIERWCARSWRSWPPSSTMRPRSITRHRSRSAPRATSRPPIGSRPGCGCSSVLATTVAAAGR